MDKSRHKFACKPFFPGRVFTSDSRCSHETVKAVAFLETQTANPLAGTTVAVLRPALTHSRGVRWYQMFSPQLFYRVFVAIAGDGQISCFFEHRNFHHMLVVGFPPAGVRSPAGSSTASLGAKCFSSLDHASGFVVASHPSERGRWYSPVYPLNPALLLSSH